MITHALEKGTTVYDKSRNSIYYLPDERVQSLGIFSIERDMSMYNMTMFKGEMFLTQYRMVFVEKSRFLDPNWMSFWFNVDFEGRMFQVEKGVGSVYDCKGMYLEMELKPIIKSIDLHVRFVMMDNNLVPTNVLNHPIKIYKSELYQILIQSRDTSPPIKASTLQEYLNKVKEPSGVYTFGTWDSALERAMRER